MPPVTGSLLLTEMIRVIGAAGPAVRDEDAGDGTGSMALGAFFFVLGTLGTALTYVMAQPGGKYTVLYGAIAWGLYSFARGLARWWRVRESRSFPVLPVGAGVVIPVLVLAGIYLQGERARSQRRTRARRCWPSSIPPSCGRAREPAGSWEAFATTPRSRRRSSSRS